jgi:hypothetical protein
VPEEDQSKIKRHYSFSEIAARMAESNWGEDDVVFEEVAGSLTCDAAGAAMLEFLRLARVVIAALARTTELQPTGYEEDTLTAGIEYAKRFPGVKIGDFLYCCEGIDDGIVRMIVIHVDDEERAVVVCAGVAPECGRIHITWASNWYFASEAEALLRAVRTEMDYHESRMQRIRLAINAAENGGDLSSFREGAIADDDDNDD